MVQFKCFDTIVEILFKQTKITDRDGVRGGFRDDGARRSEREKVPFPSHPPYIAHLGNLDYDVAESDIHDLFERMVIIKVRLVSDRDTQKFKGYAYVEFKDADSLTDALNFNGSDFRGRNIRIEIAEPRQESRGENDGWSKRELPRAVSPTRSDGRGNRYGGNRDGNDSSRDFVRDGSSRDFVKRNSFGGPTSVPLQRKKLELAPRSESKISEEVTKPDTADYGKAKPSPFGEAKPRDETAILRQFEERREREAEEKRNAEEERKQQEAEGRKKAEKERKRKEEDDKHRIEQDKLNKETDDKKNADKERGGVWTRGISTPRSPVGRVGNQVNHQREDTGKRVWNNDRSDKPLC
ncbi:hypothetical protein HK096_005251 [Nowakowskiella sp. JEL0078]|nr:hypothetical protein HK096_005251 [Nowakowskiella sp. JEL0078]